MGVFQLIADSGVFAQVNAALSLVLGIGAMAAAAWGLGVPKAMRGFVFVSLGLGAMPLIIALLGLVRLRRRAR